MAGVFSSNSETVKSSGGVFKDYKPAVKKQASSVTPTMPTGIAKVKTIPTQTSSPTYVPTKNVLPAKTPVDPSRYNILGQNILPINKEDTTLAKVGKSAVNYGLGTIGRIFSAPQQAIMQASRATVNAATGKPQNFTDMNFTKDILHAKNDNLATMAVGMALDPATYIGGGLLKGAAKGTTENVIKVGESQAKSIAGKIKVGKALTAVEQGTATELQKSNPSLTDQVRSNLGITNEGWTRSVNTVDETQNPLLQSIRNRLDIKPAGTVEVKPSARPAELPPSPIKPLKPSEGINTLPVKDMPANGVQGAREPTIPTGQKERGFSANTRTDVNNPDNLRDNFTQNPISYEQISNPDTLAKAQAVMDGGYESAVAKVGDLASRMQPEAVPLAKMLARQASEAGNVAGARAVLSDAAEKLTQAGQFSQAAKILREADPETFLMTMDKQLKNLNKDGLDAYGKKWNNMDLTPEEIAGIQGLKRGDQAAYEAMFEKIGNRMADQMPSSATEKLTAWRHVSMLLNPKTQIRNIGGNALMMGMRRTSKQVSAVLQKVFLKAEDRTQVFIVQKEFKQAAKDYFEANKSDLLRGGNKYSEGIKLNMPNKRVFAKSRIGAKLGLNIDLAEGTRKLTYKLLEMGDNPFYKNAYINRLASYAQAKGVKDLSKLGQEAFGIAKLEAEQTTYKDASALASLLTKWKHPGKGASLGNKVVAVGAEAILPFTKTPINIIKRGIQYSPAGILNGFSKISSKAGAGAAIDEMAKGLTGTGIVGLGAWLASKGVITGKAEKDTDLANYDKNTGNSPFSILGKYTYDWAQPFAVPFTIGAEIYNAVKDNPADVKKLQGAIESGNESTLQQLVQTAGSGLLDAFNASGDTVFNMSLLKNVKQALGGGTAGFMSGVAQIPQNIAMQFVPSVLSQVAGQVDTTVRNTYYKGQPLESMKATLQSKIPFASKSLPAKISPFGDPVQRTQNPYLRAFGQFVSPGNINVPQNVDPAVDAEIRRLQKDSGSVVQFPSVIDVPIEFQGQTVTLTPKEIETFQTIMGETTAATFKDKIASPEYTQANDTDKAKMLQAAISAAKQDATYQTLQGRGLAHNPLIFSMPSSLTKNKIPIELTFDQQSQLADAISAKQQKFKDLYKSAYTDKRAADARKKAEDEFKLTLPNK
jgi:hypothetical protein